MSSRQRLSSTVTHTMQPENIIDDVLSPERCKELIEKAKKVTRYRIRFFKAREGWLLCRIVLNHNIRNARAAYCALCSAIQGKDVLRKSPRAQCDKCGVR